MDSSFVSLMGVALAIGGPLISAAFAIVLCGTALAGVSTEKPELFSKLILTIVLGEALAIYGLLIGFMLLSELPNITTIEAAYKALTSGLIIAIASVAASVGIGYTGSALIGATAERAETFSSNVIGVVLSEALAIYGLLIAFIIIGQI